MTVNRSKLPFSVVSSSVTTGYNADLNTNFKQGADITGHHQDTYGGLENEPLQTTFTRTHVGGNQQRHTPINTGTDNDFSRAEAFKIKAESGQLKVYGPDFENVNKPRAQHWKGAKSPINIENIQNSGNLAGNFNKNYEVFQTSGRGITNNLVVDGFVASGSLTTQFINGANNYSLPDLSNNSKSIIVERFSAPGSKQESSRGALDRAGEELSPNNSLTTRNIKVRQPFYSQLTQHAAQFGSGSVEGVSIHKVNRNGKRRIELSGSSYTNSSQYDNYWVQHAIPQDNFGYAWITASSVSDPYTIGTSSLQFDTTSSLSTIKDKSISIDTQTIQGSIKNIEGYYSTWRQIRTGEHPVARKLRETNNIAVQNEITPTTSRLEGGYNKAKRSGTSTNFKEPPVSNKHFPIEQDIQFVSEPSGSSTLLKYTYENNASKFANEDLQERLGLQDKQVDFYKKLVDAKNVKENSPIKSVISLKFKENLYPREVNTYLSGTRSRTEYILDKPGFDRDGYDRQLGTQRVFWRDNQEDRRRSANSDGGYINSLGYSSLEESGSNFTQNDNGYTPENKAITLSSSYAIQDTESLFNSIILLESSSQDKQISTYQGIGKLDYYDQLIFTSKVSNKINARNFIKETAGEFENLFTDFVEYSNEQDNIKSVGSLYRNTSNKQLLTKKTSDRPETDIVFELQEDKSLVNPRPKYVSFAGGGELNTSSSQEVNNLIYSYGANGKVNKLLISGSDLYVGGNFSKIGGISANNIAKFNLQNNMWYSLGDGYPYEIGEMELSGNYIYVGPYTIYGNANISLKKLNTLTVQWSEAFSKPFINFSDPSGGPNGGTWVRKIKFYGNDCYIGGRNFVISGATGPTERALIVWDSSAQNWTTSSLTTGVYGIVHDILLSGNILYIAYGLSNPGGIVSLNASTKAPYSFSNTVYSDVGSVSPGSYVSSLLLSGNYLYAAGGFLATSDGPSLYTSSVAVKDLSKPYPHSKWNRLYTTSIGDCIGGKLYLNNNTLYVASLYERSWSETSYDTYYYVIPGIFRYDSGTTWTKLNLGDSQAFTDIIVTGSRIYFASIGDSDYEFNGALITGTFDNKPVSGIGYIDLNDNKIYPLTSSLNLNVGSYFSQEVSSSDIAFSTLDNGLQNVKIQTPVYDNIEDYYKSDIYQIGKDYSILPEFKISDHIENYVDTGGNFRKINTEFLELDGAEQYYKSGDLTSSSFYSDFFEKYSFTDILNKNVVEKDYSKELEQQKITINISGIKKLLPYNGFYPEHRTIQLANLYGNYVDNVLSGGVYNLSSYNEIGENYDILTNLNLTSSAKYKINLAEYNNKKYLASNLSSSKTIKIYTASLGYPTTWSTSPVAQVEYNGYDIKLLSSSAGLQLYYTSGSSLKNIVSLDGETWSSPTKLYPLSISSSYITGGYSLDIFKDQNSTTEKLIIVTSDPTTLKGDLRIYTASYNADNNIFVYSDKITSMTGSENGSNFGQSISILSCSVGYQLFVTEYFPSTAKSVLNVISSSNISSWSPRTIILEKSEVGKVALKSVNFENKNLVFSSELGRLICVSSSAENNYQWSFAEEEQKKILASFDISTSKISAGGIILEDLIDISFYSGSTGPVLYYSFCNSVDETSPGVSEFFIGKTIDGINFETQNDNNLYYKQIPKIFNAYSSSSLNCVGLQIETEAGVPYAIAYTDIISGSQRYISSISRKIYTQFTLDTSETEKYVKQAALEPVMAPGILYNTIKSGIAVDWPCATGSQTSLEPYGSGTIVNAYYPQSFKMASYTGQNINELNMYGNLRSNIDYRVDFEKLIFPNDIFTVKNTLTSSLVEKTTLTSLPQNSELVNFISGCYVYGGYEPYMSPVDFSDFNQLGPKRFSVPFVYRKEGARDTGLYSMAMSNFLAETVKFFLKDELLTAFQSKPDSQWESFEQDKKYYMDIVISKEPNLVMMEAYHSSKHPTGSYGEKMHGRYFGYPVNKTNKKLWSAQAEELFTSDESKLIHNDPAYAPYTPPYFEGTAIARVSFTPSITGKYTLDEVLSELVIEDIFPGVSRGAHTGSDAYLNKMPVESSLNIKGKLPWVDTTNSNTGEKSNTTNNSVNTWIIGTRFETPVLDFSKQELIPYENNYSKTSGYGRGMWSGYGEIPKGNKGIYVSLQESFPQNLNRRTGPIQSLLQKVGFEQTSKKIGTIADEKQISEGIMIIPFIEISDQERSKKRKYGYGTDSKVTRIERELGIQFIGINKDIYKSVVNKNIDSSILNTYNSMSKFVIPPELDYKKFETIDPFVAYIVEFTHTLSKQDLADIWQGVAPEIAKKAELQDVTLSHANTETDFYHGKGIPNEDVRFMVFKVKQKGEFNYFKVTKDSTDDVNFSFEQKIGRKVDDYSYNWPYDYFSLVELAKINIEIDYKKKK